MAQRAFDHIWPQPKTYSRKSSISQRTLNVLKSDRTAPNIFEDVPAGESRFKPYNKKHEENVTSKDKKIEKKSALGLVERNLNIQNNGKHSKQFSLFSDLQEPCRGRKKKHTFGHALGKVPSMRPIKSPRFGSHRCINMLSSQLETITSSQENTDAENCDTQTSVDTYGGKDIGDSQLSTLETLDLETITPSQFSQRSSQIPTPVVRNATEETNPTGSEYTLTWATATNFEQTGDSDGSIEMPRRAVVAQREPVLVASPIEIIKEDDRKKKNQDVDSPALEYATYWTQPANRFRLSSTLMDDSAELDIHRPLPAPDMSAITEAHDIPSIQKRQETTPSAKASAVCPRRTSKRSLPPADLEVTPSNDRNEIPHRAGPRRKTSFGDSALGSETLCSLAKSKTAKTIDFGGTTVKEDVPAPPILDFQGHQKAAHIKMTSTPELSSHLLKNAFSVELSAIASGNPDVELDIDESREVNSQEIVADSPDDDEDPLLMYWKPKENEEECIERDMEDQAQLNRPNNNYHENKEEGLEKNMEDQAQISRPKKDGPWSQNEAAKKVDSNTGKNVEDQAQISQEKVDHLSQVETHRKVCKNTGKNVEEHAKISRQEKRDHSSLSETLRKADNTGLIEDVVHNVEESSVKRSARPYTESHRRRSKLDDVVKRLSMEKGIIPRLSQEKRIINEQKSTNTSQTDTNAASNISSSVSNTFKSPVVDIERCSSANLSLTSVSFEQNKENDKAIEYPDTSRKGTSINSSKAKQLKETPISTKLSRKNETTLEKIKPTTSRNTISKSAKDFGKTKEQPSKGRTSHGTKRRVSSNKANATSTRAKKTPSKKSLANITNPNQSGKKTTRKSSNSKTKIKHHDSVTSRKGKIMFDSGYPDFDNIEDDILTRDDYPIPQDAFPKTVHLLRHIKPLRPEMITDAPKYPHDIFEDVDSDDGVFN